MVWRPKCRTFSSNLSLQIESCFEQTNVAYCLSARTKVLGPSFVSSYQLPRLSGVWFSLQWITDLIIICEDFQKDCWIHFYIQITGYVPDSESLLSEAELELLLLLLSLPDELLLLALSLEGPPTSTTASRASWAAVMETTNHDWRHPGWRIHIY